MTFGLPFRFVEEWRQVVGTSLYEVSDLGRVRSYGKYYKGGIMTGTLRKGYVLVAIHGRQRPVHQLVLEAFVGPCPEGLTGLHENDVKTDNRLSNLSWGTYSKNMHDRVRNGIHHLATRTHCKHNHPLSGDNLKIDKRGVRVCITCARRRANEYNQKLREHGIQPGKPGARLPKPLP